MTDTPTATDAAIVTVALDFPFRRGDQLIERVQIRRPRAGELRGLNITDLVQMNIVATTTLLPRITMPPLTQQEVSDLDPADFTQFGMEIQDFLLPKAARADASPQA